MKTEYKAPCICIRYIECEHLIATSGTGESFDTPFEYDGF